VTKKALILGITGQDGSYLAEILTGRGYEVHGMVRHTSGDNLFRLRQLPCFDKLILWKGDMLDSHSVDRLMLDIRPDEVYNEADQDNIDFSYKTPTFSAQITFEAVVRLLQTIRTGHSAVRLFQPVSATVFGSHPYPQNEQTPLAPASPYACAKAAALLACRHYRREYGLFVSTGILYNHDSPRRRGGYLLHKIAQQAIQVSRGTRERMELPPLDILVDIGHAYEYMEAATRSLRCEVSDDYVLSSGHHTSIKLLASLALSYVGVDEGNQKDVIQQFPVLSRPGTPPTLVGDCQWARQRFGFNPTTHVTSILSELIALYRNIPEKDWA